MHKRVPWWCWLQVRTKVFKCLGAVVEADSRVMASAEVAAAVQAAQEDDSAAVKEAVLELLVKLININPQLAGEYFDTLRQASYVSHCWVDALNLVTGRALTYGPVRTPASSMSLESCHLLPWLGSVQGLPL